MTLVVVCMGKVCRPSFVTCNPPRKVKCFLLTKGHYECRDTEPTWFKSYKSNTSEGELRGGLNDPKSGPGRLRWNF